MDDDRSDKDETDESEEEEEEAGNKQHGKKNGPMQNGHTVHNNNHSKTEWNVWEQERKDSWKKDDKEDEMAFPKTRRFNTVTLTQTYTCSVKLLENTSIKIDTTLSGTAFALSPQEKGNHVSSSLLDVCPTNLSVRQERTWRGSRCGGETGRCCCCFYFSFHVLTVCLRASW